jgi:hypothetical protein
MIILTLLDYVVLGLLTIGALAISCIIHLSNIARETESMDWDLPVIDIDGNDTHGAEIRQAILKGGQQ